MLDPVYLCEIRKSDSLIVTILMIESEAYLNTTDIEPSLKGLIPTESCILRWFGYIVTINVWNRIALATKMMH